jgi:hypothetical protein
MADASIGEVDIILNGKARTLRCSLAAAKVVNAAANGCQGMIARLGMMDLDAYITVVAAGLNQKYKDVEEPVYKTGMPALNGPLIEFVTYLANGGRPIVAAEEKDDDGTGEA